MKIGTMVSIGNITTTTAIGMAIMMITAATINHFVH